MKASRKITPKQFKSAKDKDIAIRLAMVQWEARKMAKPNDPSINVGIALDCLTKMFKSINDKLEVHNANWSQRIQEVNEYREWVAATPGNEEYLKGFDKLSILDKMALFTYNRIVNDEQR